MKISRKLGSLLVSSVALAALSLPASNLPALAQAPAAKPNILFIMGDDIGWMQPGIYHRGLMVGETPNIDRIGNEGAIFMTYYAEQSCTAGRNAFFTGMNPLRTGMIPPQLPGSPSYLRPGTPALAKFLLDLGYTTGEFGKNHLGDHARLPGILGLPVSPRCDAGRELPGHQQDLDPADGRPALQEHTDPRPPGSPGGGGSDDDGLPDAAPACALVQVLRRHEREPDMPGSGPAYLGAVEDGG
jgi:arylsulfatase A-like enzyme